jgi:predicted metal-dependent HD superfamily phosphohydrolase
VHVLFGKAPPLHTLTHLTRIFDCLELHGEEIGDPARLAFAAWYHDVVYDPRRTDNEAKSAERAMKELDALGAPNDVRSHVVQLILATKNHMAGGRDYDDDIFLDADFAILGSPHDEYRQYVVDVRAEYAHVDDAAWLNGRGTFLKKISAAPRIFRTGIFEGEYAPPSPRKHRLGIDRARSVGRRVLPGMSGILPALSDPSTNHR